MIREFVDAALRGERPDPISGHLRGTPRIKAVKAAFIVGLTAYKSLRAGWSIEITSNVPDDRTPKEQP
jgi:hypothetical protein